MTVDQIRNLLKSQPFKPFNINLASGQSVRVKHPELILITPSGRTAFVVTHDDAGEIIDLFLAVSVSVGNGHSKRKRTS